MNDPSSHRKLVLTQLDLMYDILPFKNPVCKQTYQSLPRIYGNKKIPKSKFQYVKPKYGRKQILQTPKYPLTPDNLKGISRYLFPGSGKNKNSKIGFLAFNPGLRVMTDGDIQTCRQYNRDSSIYKKNKPTQIETDIKSFHLSDLQTSHKVNYHTTEGREPSRPSSQLQKLVLNKRKLMPIIQFQKQQQNQLQTKGKVLTQRNGVKLKSIAINTFNNYYTQQHMSNQIIKKKMLRRSFKSIQQQNQQQTQKPVYSLHNEKQNKLPNSETNSQSQRSAISLSRHVFNQKRDPTMFRSLDKKFRNSRMNSTRMSQINSTLENGTFRIPEQKQYRLYIQRYKPMSEKFNLLELFKKNNFKIIRTQKSVYFGEVNQFNQKHGYGVSVSQKQIFEGEHFNNQKVSGFQRNIDGVYIGGYKEGLRFGQGTFRWNNQQVFLGQWKNGMKNGFGKWKAPQGHYYEGEWVQNRQNGYGLFRHNMSTYKGLFKNFLKHGQGEQVFINGDKYKGQYKQGKPDGQGRYQWDKGGYYEGQFKQGKRQGYGVWLDDEGTKYQGQFADDFKHGYGKQIYKTGQKFQGIFQLGSKTNGKLYNNFKEQIQIMVK